jgi:iron(III) transport system substrate-binding protein
MTNFITKYGEDLGLSDSNASATKKSDSEIYTLLEAEAESSSRAKNASVVLIQDSATLDTYRNGSTLLANYLPKGIAENVDKEYLVPLAHQFINKLFMYNVSDTSNTLKFTNVWQLTEASYKNRIYFKSPKNEQVNMNFLIMLTNSEWSGKLESAYLSYNNNVAANDVGEGKTYTNYGYKWIAEFLANCNFSINSDTTIAEDLSKTDNAGKMGLFVLSKLRASTVTAANLQVSAWDKETAESTTYQTIEPFAGFMYAIYAQLCNSAPRPYTAMLFVNYLMTEEGFSPWASMGGYSSNKNIAVTTGDSELSFWKDRLVIEDGTYISSVKTSVTDWINTKLA